MPLSWEAEGWNSRGYKAAGVMWGLQSTASCWAEKSLPCPGQTGMFPSWEAPLLRGQLLLPLSYSILQHYNMGCTLWSRTILRACPMSEHFILTSRISSGRTESWKDSLGLWQLKFCRCRGLVEAALVPVVPLWQPLPRRHCWNCRLAVKTGRAENCLWPQGCCSWKYFKHFL